MFATTHVVTGAVIGRLVKRPAAAFGLGILSHLALDALPHWGMDITVPGARRRFLAIAVTDGLTLSAVLAVLVRRGRPTAEVTGALGALLLDMDKPTKELGVEQLWPDWLHHAHIDIQVWEAPHRWPIDATVALASLAYLARTSSTRTR
jgi:hypothetical protein